HFAAEVHRDLTRIYDLAASFASCNIRSGNVKMLGYRINNELRSDDFLFIWRNNIAEHLFCKVQVDLTFLQIGICYDFVKAPSSSRMLDLMLDAMYSITSSPTL